MLFSYDSYAVLNASEATMRKAIDFMRWSGVKASMSGHAFLVGFYSLDFTCGLDAAMDSCDTVEGKNLQKEFEDSLKALHLWNELIYNY